MHFPSLALTASLCATGAVAVTHFSDGQMQSYLQGGGVDLAVAYAPLWFFGAALHENPCIPDWAYGGSPTQPDTYDQSHLTPPAKQCEYPNVGCNCRNPDVGFNHPTPAFPVYFSYRQCNSSEVRVAYNLFYQKDGAKAGPIETGHNYDWERVIIIHSQFGDNSWAPTRALLSSHGGYHNLAWGDIHNTLTTQQINAGDANTPNGVRNNDHPKVYVGWSKHSNFDTKETEFVDPASQSLNNAFRSNDWWHFVSSNQYIRSDPSTAAGRAMSQTNWGSADSDPPKVHNEMCDAS